MNDKNKEYREALEQLILRYSEPMGVPDNPLAPEYAIKWAEIINCIGTDFEPLPGYKHLVSELFDLSREYHHGKKIPKYFVKRLKKAFETFDAIQTHPVKAKEKLYIIRGSADYYKECYKMRGYSGPDSFFIEFIVPVPEPRNHNSFIETKDGQLKYNKVFSKPLENHTDAELEEISKKTYENGIKLPLEELCAYRDRAKISPVNGRYNYLNCPIMASKGEDKIFGNDYRGGKIVD